MVAYCVDFESGTAPGQVGVKFSRLSAIRGRFPVPQAVCLTVDAFRDSLSEEAALDLSALFEEIRGTLGAGLIAALPEVGRRLEGLSMAPPVREALADRLAAAFGSLDGRRFAVRSSGVAEDGEVDSFAGVHSSFLDREGLDAICASVVDCWRSYYSERAVVARLRSGEGDPAPRLGVIVQAMVAPDLAGVAFSTGGGTGAVAIEYVDGLGDRLVSGAATPRRFFGRAGDVVGLPEAPALVAVCRAAAALADDQGHDVDVEWAWNAEGLHVVQVRPVTAPPVLPLAEVARPFQLVPLYAAGAPAGAFPLGPCEPIVRYYVEKRASAFQLAEALGVPTGAASVLGFTGDGLRDHREEFEAALRGTPAASVVLDIRHNLRQIILPKPDVYPFLAATFGDRGQAPHALILRDYHRGELGFISCLIDGGRSLYVEYACEGLLAMNRGTASARGIRVDLRGGPTPGRLDGDDDPAERQPGSESERAERALRAVLSTVEAMTVALVGRGDASQLEWVLDAGRPIFVDFSRADRGVEANSSEGVARIAGGEARGPAFLLEDAPALESLSAGPAVSVAAEAAVIEHRYVRDLLRRLSACPVKPVVVAERPWAILSIAFEHVAGFVFREGALLCHLAILLREQGIPAVICPGLEISEGAILTIDDSRLIVGPPAESPS